MCIFGLEFFFHILNNGYILTYLYLGDTAIARSLKRN